MSLPSDLIRALYDVQAFRGSRSPGATARGKWWGSTPDEANMYTSWGPTAPITEGSSVIPGQLNTRDFVHADAAGVKYDRVPVASINNPAVRELLIDTYRPRDPEKLVVSTDAIAAAVEELKLPGATILNVKDMAEQPAHQYYVADPRRRRSRFARFQDPNSEDLMAGLLMSIMGGGAGAAALNANQDET